MTSIYEIARNDVPAAVAWFRDALARGVTERDTEFREGASALLRLQDDPARLKQELNKLFDSK